jgi:hypothetical protein
MLSMLPINPTSVKYPPEMRQRMRDNAAHLSYTFSNYTRQCVNLVDEMVESPFLKWPPMIVALKLARGFHEHLNLPPKEEGGVAPEIQGEIDSPQKT